MALQQYLNDARVRAFLDAIATGEGTFNNYNVLYGGGRFSSYAAHPNKRICAGKYCSTAAGRYQFLYATWESDRRVLGLPDFSPSSQDLAAIYELQKNGALGRILAGDFQGAVAAARGTWPSLPGGSRQTRNWQQATATYNAALGGASGAANNVLNSFLPDVSSGLASSGLNINTILLFAVAALFVRRFL